MATTHLVNFLFFSAVLLLQAADTRGQWGATDDCRRLQSTAEYCRVTTENCRVTTDYLRAPLKAEKVQQLLPFVSIVFPPRNSRRRNSESDKTPNRKLCHQRPVGHAPAVSTHFLDGQEVDVAPYLARLLHWVSSLPHCLADPSAS